MYATLSKWLLAWWIGVLLLYLINLVLPPVHVM